MSIDLTYSSLKLLATAPEGIIHLKEMILTLAVRGKLVPQDSNDEPSSKLINKIRMEKARLVEEGKIKIRKLIPLISEAEIPYHLPKSWDWVRLGDISERIHYGYTASANHSENGIKFLRITDIQDNLVSWNEVPSCTINDKDLPKFLCNFGDLLIARTGGTIGKSYFFPKVDYKTVFASYLIRIVPMKKELSPFIKKFLESSIYWTQLYHSSKGTGQPNVNATALSRLILPFPSMSEQSRIVEKVDKLMIICDELEEKIIKREGIAVKYAKSVVNSVI